MPDFPTLFSPIALGPHEARNRVVMAAMVRNYATADGEVTDRHVAHLERIAAGGTGTLIMEASYVRPDGRGFTHELAIDRDDVVPGWRRLVETAHGHGALVGPQLYHAGRQTRSEVTGTQPVAPSPLAGPMMGELPRALSVDEIHQVVADFAAGARRARDAGCDLVEVHGAHGYLLTQFLSPFTNERDDEYGGDLEHRMRLLTEVVEAVRAETEGMALLVRLSGEELVPDGVTIEDTVVVARRLEELGADAIHVTAGNYASYTSGLMIQPMAVDDAPLVPLASRVRQEVSVPVVTVGKIRFPHLAEQALVDGHADLVALGRSLLADPEWPNRARDGHADRIRHCIACNQGCIGRLFRQEDVWCTVNPEAGRELEFDRPRGTSRPVLVVGGGPAGMEAARVAAERGHRVTLCERSDRLGGQLLEAVVPPHRPGWEEIRSWLAAELDRLGVDVRLGTEVTAELVQEEAPEMVIAAPGSEPVRPDVPGMNLDHVITARDLLGGRAEARGAVVVAGGGCSGAQTAELLAERGHEVTVVEATGEVAADAPVDDRALLLGRLEDRGVRLLTDAPILRIHPDEVSVSRNGREERIPAETVVICLGMRPTDGLAGRIGDLGVEVVTVGDAVEPRKVTEAMVEGARAALSI